MSVRLAGFLAVTAAIVVAAYLAFFDAPLAPQVQFKTLTGESISTNDLRGKVVLVEFWATSCVTCVEEMP